MRNALGLAFVLSACGFSRSSSDFTCSITADCEGGRVCKEGFCVVGQDDAFVPPDAPLFTCTDWMPAPRHFDPCMIPLPFDPPLVLDSPGGVYTFDTSTGILAGPGGEPIAVKSMPTTNGHVMSVSSLTVTAGTTLQAKGAAPLIIASWTDMTIAGTIDAGGKADAHGAGGNPASCADHAAEVGGNANGGAAGAGGGGFKGPGGAGGDGGSSANNGAGGTAVPLPLLLGGCPGAVGGIAVTPGGVAGGAGGAIQLTARMTIAITGAVTAGGGGGGAALGDAATGNGGGGGGGGSGGMIGLEAPTLMVMAGAFLTANGGGGGQGGGNANGGPGTDGIAAIGRPAGGTGGDAGGGGLGSGGATLNGQQGIADGAEGGGGGGGGAGYIAILSASATLVGATISPAETIVPP